MRSSVWDTLILPIMPAALHHPTCAALPLSFTHTHTHSHSHSQANENDLKVTIVRELITHDSCLTLPLTYKASDWLISTWLLSHTLTRWKPGQKGVNVGICMHVSMICDFQHDNLLSCLPRQHLTIPECIATHSMGKWCFYFLKYQKIRELVLMQVENFF